MTRPKVPGDWEQPERKGATARPLRRDTTMSSSRVAGLCLSEWEAQSVSRKSPQGLLSAQIRPLLLHAWLPTGVLPSHPEGGEGLGVAEQRAPGVCRPRCLPRGLDSTCAGFPAGGSPATVTQHGAGAVLRSPRQSRDSKDARGNFLFNRDLPPEHTTL